MKEGGGEGCKRECEVVGGISDGPEDGGPEEEEAPADDDTGGTSKIGGGGEMGVEDAGDEVDYEGKGVGDEMVLGCGFLKV